MYPLVAELAIWPFRLTITVIRAGVFVAISNVADVGPIPIGTAFVMHFCEQPTLDERPPTAGSIVVCAGCVSNVPERTAMWPEASVAATPIQYTVFGCRSRRNTVRDDRNRDPETEASGGPATGLPVLERRRAVTTTFAGTVVSISTVATDAVVVTAAFWMHWSAQPPGATRIGGLAAEAGDVAATAAAAAARTTKARDAMRMLENMASSFFCRRPRRGRCRRKPGDSGFLTKR